MVDVSHFPQPFLGQYQLHLKHLKLKGLQPKTIEAYARGMRRIGEYFSYRVDALSADQMAEYFADLMASHSWSGVKLDLYGWKFFSEHVLGKPWVAPNFIRPPKVSRRLDFHPHVHMVMPAAALDAARGLWRTKCRAGGGYLFNHKALAKVFRGKVMDAIKAAGLTLPDKLPNTWVVDCKSVGDGQKALLYLGRYLYRGVVQEADILGCKDAVTDRHIGASP